MFWRALRWLIPSIVFRSALKGVNCGIGLWGWRYIAFTVLKIGLRGISRGIVLLLALGEGTEEVLWISHVHSLRAEYACRTDDV